MGSSVERETDSGRIETVRSYLGHELVVVLNPPFCPGGGRDEPTAWHGQG